MRACFSELLYFRIHCIENDFAILELLNVKILLLFLSIMCTISAI